MNFDTVLTLAVEDLKKSPFIQDVKDYLDSENISFPRACETFNEDYLEKYGKVLAKTLVEVLIAQYPEEDHYDLPTSWRVSYVLTLDSFD